MSEEYVIVPKVATGEMVEAMNFQYTQCSAHISDLYDVALQAAPPHNMVAIDKDELERLRQTLLTAANALHVATSHVPRKSNISICKDFENSTEMNEREYYNGIVKIAIEASRPQPLQGVSDE